MNPAACSCRVSTNVMLSDPRQAVEQVEIFLTRNAEYVCHSFAFETLDEEVGCFGHIGRVSFWAGYARQRDAGGDVPCDVR